MHATLIEQLRSKSPLPEGWSPVDGMEDVVQVDGLQLRRAGLMSVGPGGEQVTGAAAEVSGSPLLRGYYELLERVSTLEAMANPRDTYDLMSIEGECIASCSATEIFPESDEPADWRYARSNGVAIHADWVSAARSAFWELAERDRLLRAWRGEVRPEDVSHLLRALPVASAASYEWLAVAFPETQRGRFSKDVEVVAIAGFPRSDAAPLVMGFGGRPTREAAIAAASAEALQQLAFLWDERGTAEIPTSAPTPLFHLEYFQFIAHRPLIRRWLEGEHAAFEGEVALSAPDIAFVDLTPTWLASGLRVAKAYSPHAVQLAFGAAPNLRRLPSHLRAHPIA